MLGAAVHLDISPGSTSYSEALKLPISFAKAYLGHDFYSQDTKNAEAQQKLLISGLNGINGVIKAIHGLGKALAGRR